jgi:Tfp pilus assembly ATPase PilU
MPNNMPIQLQITLYNPNTQRILRSVVYPVPPQRRVEIRNDGRLDMEGIIHQRIILLTTDKKGALERWRNSIVSESGF